MFPIDDTSSGRPPRLRGDYQRHTVTVVQYPVGFHLYIQRWGGNCVHEYWLDGRTRAIPCQQCQDLSAFTGAPRADFVAQERSALTEPSPRLRNTTPTLQALRSFSEFVWGRHSDGEPVSRPASPHLKRSLPESRLAGADADPTLLGRITYEEPEKVLLSMIATSPRLPSACRISDAA